MAIKLLSKLFSHIYWKEVKRNSIEVVEKHRLLGFTFYYKKRTFRYITKIYFKLFTTKGAVSSAGERVHEGLFSSFNQLDEIQAVSAKPFISVLITKHLDSVWGQRLEAVHRQSYSNYEVIFLDKNLSELARWHEGLKQAKGELVWFADFMLTCDSRFLEEMAKPFIHQCVMIAFPYRSNVQKIVSAHVWVNRFLAVQPLFPDMGTSLCRRVDGLPDELFAQSTALSAASSIWLLYLWLVKGGAVGFVPTQCSQVESPINLAESYQIACNLVRQFKIESSVWQQLKKHYHSVEVDCKQMIRAAGEFRPNVLMCSYGMLQGGGEIFPIYLANELRKQQAAVTFVDFRLGAYDEEIRKKLDSSIPLIELKDIQSLPLLLDMAGIEVVHTHEANVDTAVGEVLNHSSSSCKQVITLHGMYEMMKSAVLQRVLQEVIQSCACFVYIADKNLVPFQGVKDSVCLKKVGNGLPLVPIHQVNRSSLGISDEDFCITLVSRSLFDKGWLEAIEAVNLANEKSDRLLHLVLIGTGECYDYLQKQDLPSYIHLLGRKSNVRDYFAMSDLGLLPSKYKGESFPLVVIESLMSGTPVVATALGEVKNMLTTAHGKMAGVLIDLENGQVPVHTLANILAELAVNKSSYEQLKEQVELAVEKFKIEHIAQKYMNIYKKVLYGYE